MRSDANGERIVKVFDKEGLALESFDFNCTGIRSLKGLIQGLWSLNPFSEGLSNRNGFSDMDAQTEIDGRSLTLEFKRSFRALNKGQVMKAIRMAKFQKTCTWFIEGETDLPVRIFCINETGVEGEYRVTEVENTDLINIQGRIKNWEQFAKKNSLVKGYKTEEWNAISEIIRSVNLK